VEVSLLQLDTTTHATAAAATNTKVLDHMLPPESKL